jgi:hypothetical protein
MFMDAEFVKDGGACMTVITGGWSVTGAWLLLLKAPDDFNVGPQDAEKTPKKITVQRNDIFLGWKLTETPVNS